jgi:hypothetical protein
LVGIHESELGDYSTRYNIAPTEPYFVVTTKFENRKAIPGQLGSGKFMGEGRQTRFDVYQREGGNDR